MPIGRRFVLSAAAASAAGLLLPRASSATGMDDALDLGYRSGLLSDLHAVLASQNGRVVLEAYFSGEDQAWGTPLGSVSFGPSSLHDLRSVTKSIVSLLYGIALEREMVPPPQARLLDAFPEHADLASDPVRARWTISNAFNMRLGTEWNEALPYTDPANSEIQMENAPDRVRFVLDRAIVARPGTTWSYNGGATALIGEIIARGAGVALDVFAQDALFAPLGITEQEWLGGRDGASAASGLRLTAPALLRIGQMMLNNGVWMGTQVVPSSWLDLLRKPRAQTTFGLQYSHQWYLSSQFSGARPEPYRMLSAAGNGGQRLYILPELDLCVVVFAGGYNRRDDWMTPTLVLQRIVLPHLKA